MKDQEIQEKINEHLDGLLDDALQAMGAAGPIEMITIGTALILIGLKTAPDEEKSKAWQKLRDFLATQTKH